jgi:SAM-dependent methyltransferase
MPGVPSRLRILGKKCLPEAAPEPAVEIGGDTNLNESGTKSDHDRGIRIWGNAVPLRSMDYWERYARAADQVIRPVLDEDHVFQGEGRNLTLYHFNGLSALRVIVTGLIMYDVRVPRSFLDFGCAYGRALRYFKAAFPEASLTACDLRADAIAYCAKTFDATPVMSAVRFNDVRLPHQHDVIWLGSVFTHFDAEACTILLDKMLENLVDGGLLVFSLHGRVYPQEVQPRRWKILEDDAFAVAKAGYEATGFGYHDYPGRPGVGASLTSPAWVFDLLRSRPDVIFAYQERAWTGWHDVAYVYKTSTAPALFDRYKDRPY